MQRRILVTDLDPQTVATLTESGKSLQVTVSSVSPKSMVERARQQKPDLIVLDVAHTDGMELLSLLRTSRDTANIPVVVVSPNDSLEERELALELGAETFVPRPVGPDLLARLMTLLGSR